MTQTQDSAQAAIQDFLLVMGNARKLLLQIAVLSLIVLQIVSNAHLIVI